MGYALKNAGFKGHEKPRPYLSNPLKNKDSVFRICRIFLSRPPLIKDYLFESLSL
jgi:hypothetical protein